MKVARCLLKLFAFCLAVAAVACCIIAYWDKICAFLTSLSEKCREKKASCPLCSSEYEDYADWDD